MSGEAGGEGKGRGPGRVVLLSLAALVVIALTAHAPLLLRYRREHAIEKHFEAVGGRCAWDGSPPRPLSLLGETYAKLFMRVDGLTLRRTRVTDAGLVHLEGLAGLKHLDLMGTQITDGGIVHLKGLVRLQWLNLRNTQITDAGLVPLKGLAGLQLLDLHNTQITDAGLAHLKALAGLQELYLYNTQITDWGVADLKAALPGLNVYRSKPAFPLHVALLSLLRETSQRRERGERPATFGLAVVPSQAFPPFPCFVLFSPSSASSAVRCFVVELGRGKGTAS